MASCRNRHGVRVYIPLKGSTGGRKWVKPVRFSVLRVQEALPLVFSFRSTTQIELAFTMDELVFYEPFSHGMMETYRVAGASERRAVAGPMPSKMAMWGEDQDVEELEGSEYEEVAEAVEKIQLEHGREMTKKEIAEVIISVGAGKFSVVVGT